METENKLKLLLQKKKLIILCIYIMSVAFGIDVVLVESEPTIKDFFLGVLFATLLTFYCLYDSQLRKKTLPYFSRWLIFLTWPLSVPIYIFWSQGKKKILISILQILSVPGVVLASIIVLGIIFMIIDPSRFQ
jgi:hypothetical protein